MQCVCGEAGVNSVSEDLETVLRTLVDTAAPEDLNVCTPAGSHTGSWVPRLALACQCQYPCVSKTHADT